MTTPNPGTPEAIKPVRIQRSRRKGSKMVSPNGLPVVCVSRGTKYGNPFKVGMRGQECSDAAANRGRLRMDIENGPVNRSECVEMFRFWLCEVPERKDDPMPSVEQIRSELRGKNLACWCPLPKPGEPDQCHAAALLELANKPQPRFYVKQVTPVEFHVCDRETNDRAVGQFYTSRDGVYSGEMHAKMHADRLNMGQR